jgi:hypothetical protein
MLGGIFGAGRRPPPDEGGEDAGEAHP